MVRNILVAVLALLLITGMACKKKDESSPTGTSQGTVAAQLVGTWTLTSVTVDGQPASLATVFNFEPTTVVARIIVAANATFTFVELDGSNVQTYSSAGIFTTAGQNFTMTVTAESGQPVSPPVTLASGTWAVAGNQCVLTFARGQETIALTVTK